MDTIGLGNTILENIISPELQRSLFPMKVLFILISLIAIVLMIWLFKKSSYKNFLFLDWWNDYKLLKSIRMGEFDKAEDTEKDFVEIKEKEVNKEIKKEINKEEINKEETSDWQRVMDKLGTKNELKCKLALLDASRLLDKSLNEKGKNLRDLGNSEKMQKIKDYLERLLEHPHKSITFHNANNIIREYEIALKELGAI